ncbi:hypothetical protein GQ473_06790 [archaeon]|nr:hypothetical protein [archaeon]
MTSRTTTKSVFKRTLPPILESVKKSAVKAKKSKLPEETNVVPDSDNDTEDIENDEDTQQQQQTLEQQDDIVEMEDDEVSTSGDDEDKEVQKIVPLKKTKTKTTTDTVIQQRQSTSQPPQQQQQHEERQKDVSSDLVLEVGRTVIFLAQYVKRNLIKWKMKSNTHLLLNGNEKVNNFTLRAVKSVQGCNVREIFLAYGANVERYYRMIMNKNVLKFVANDMELLKKRAKLQLQVMLPTSTIGIDDLLCTKKYVGSSEFLARKSTDVKYQNVTITSQIHVLLPVSPIYKNDHFLVLIQNIDFATLFY